MAKPNTTPIGSLLWMLAMAVLPPEANAQGLPASQVWLVPLGSDDLTGSPVRISPDGGYNNQPHFSPDSQSLYFTAEQGGGQTDIWRYTLADRSLSPVTQSIESEYSPTPVPGEAALSVIRVEAELRQRLWRIRLDDGSASVLLPDVEPVGYHAWLASDRVALFILGETSDLHVAQAGNGGSKRIRANIGRTLRRHPVSGKLLIVDRSVEPPMIMALDTELRTEAPMLSLFPGGEDFEVDANGTLWTGNKACLYRAKPGARRWSLFANLSEWGIGNISRMAASPDGHWLAVVSSP